MAGTLGVSTPSDLNGQLSGNPQSLLKDSSISVQSAAVAESSSDPATSLRARALSTLKSKRRKPAVERSSSVPFRPIPDSSFQLDYGQAESIPSHPGYPAADPVSISSAPALSSEAEDGQLREEGEISDTEENVPSTAAISPPKTGLKSPAPRKSSLVRRQTSPFITPAAQPGAPASQPLLERISDPITPQTPKAVSSAPYQLGPDHVRPHLAMNQEQYDTAKDVILDLLGWGVAPEYLVDCGLTRPLIFYVFNELKLRLPTNLDTAGIFPYSPDAIGSLNPPSDRSQFTGSLSTPSQSTIRADSFHASLHSRITVDNPIITTRLSAPEQDVDVSPETLPLLSTVPVASTSSPLTSPAMDGPSLHDMEQQRRQELLARKAVQASRKQRPAVVVGGNGVDLSSSTAPTSSGEQKDTDVDMASLVPTETVDDFLNSIGPVAGSSADTGKGKGARPTTAAERIHQRLFGKSDEMDVDDPIPGFVTSGHSDPASSGPMFVQSSMPNPSCSPTSYPDIPTPTSADPPFSAHSDPPPSSADSGFSGPSTVLERSPSTEEKYVNGNGASNDGSDRPRRGTKRPVAADFVDLEPRPPSSVGYINGHGVSLVRRKTGSFAGVSGMRRCVIDVSDSEDDGEGRQFSMDIEDRHWEQRTNSPFSLVQSSRAGWFGPGSAQQGSHSGYSTPPHHGVTSSGSAGTMSPAALLEKEQEIRRMRELIAKKEESRLKKFAISGRSTPSVTASAQEASHMATSALAGPSILPPVPIKQEEDPTPTLVTPSIMNGTSSNGEDSAMQDGNTEQPMISVPDLSARASRSPHIDELDPKATVDDSVGERVITAEARQEPVIGDRYTKGSDEGRGRGESAGGGGGRGSMSMEALDEGYRAYDSPLECYPLLRARLRPVLADEAVSGLVRPLRMARMVKRIDPLKRICQYEVPGGGVCRDGGCADVHLNDGGDELSDEDRARYLQGATALGTLEERVVAALDTGMGRRPAR